MPEHCVVAIALCLRGFWQQQALGGGFIVPKTIAFLHVRLVLQLLMCYALLVCLLLQCQHAELPGTTHSSSMTSLLRACWQQSGPHQAPMKCHQQSHVLVVALRCYQGQQNQLVWLFQRCAGSAWMMCWSAAGSCGCSCSKNHRAGPSAHVPGRQSAKLAVQQCSVTWGQPCMATTSNLEASQKSMTTTSTVNRKLHVLAKCLLVLVYQPMPAIWLWLLLGLSCSGAVLVYASSSSNGTRKLQFAFQKQGVKWMLQRERDPGAVDCSSARLQVGGGTLTLLCPSPLPAHIVDIVMPKQVHQ